MSREHQTIYALFRGFGWWCWEEPVSGFDRRSYIADVIYIGETCVKSRNIPPENLTLCQEIKDAARWVHPKWDGRTLPPDELLTDLERASRIVEKYAGQ